MIRWPHLSERAWVTLGLYVMATTMLWMGFIDRSLWNVELFKVIVQAVVISGFINMVLAFHFAANKGDELKSINTGKAFDAITAANSPTEVQDVKVVNEPDDAVPVEPTP